MFYARIVQGGVPATYVVVMPRIGKVLLLRYYERQNRADEGANALILCSRGSDIAV